MSFILDALRKLEKEKKESPPVDLKARLMQDTPPGLSSKSMMITAGVATLVLSSAVTWAAILYLKEPDFTKASPTKPILATNIEVESASAEMNPEAIVQAALARKKGTVTPMPFVAAESRKKPISRGLGMEEEVWEDEEEEFLINPVEIDTGAEYRNASLREESEVFSAAPGNNLFPMAGSANMILDKKEAERFALEGIVFHENPKHRSAMLRKKGERGGTMVKIGDKFKGLRVSQIEPSSVILLNGSRAVVLSMD